jgi:phosphoribosylformimino-5-aminoimidazole carboxamide ribotide isomerase
MRIIPAIDIISGQCVRLTNGDYRQKKVYNSNPLEVAKSFADHGIKYLHLVDLDGARTGRVENLKVVEQIAGNTDLIIDFGGGLRTTRDIMSVFDAGASQITGGSIAVKNETLFKEWMATFGSRKIILGADARHGKIAIQGWAEHTDLSVSKFIGAYQQKGIETVICTDISKDGVLQGPSLELYRAILRENPGIKLIASGGVSSVRDLAALKSLKVDGVIIGKAIYENRITLKQLSSYVN